MPKKSNFQLTLEDLDLKKPTKNNILDNLLKLPKKDNNINTPHHVTDEVNTIQQADLLYLPDDNGFKYLLVVVDLGSRLMDAQEIKNRDATTVRNAMIKLYKRKILQEPLVLQVDGGSEFQGPFKTHFSYFFKIHTHEAGRHRSQGLIEARNKILGKIIFRFQQIEELHTGNQNTEWVRYLPKIIQTINKHYKETPEVIDSMHHLPRADGDSRYVYPVGTKVRRQLDNPKGMNNEKLFGRWRSTDYRWDQKISTVTSVYMAPDSPVLY